LVHLFFPSGNATETQGMSRFCDTPYTIFGNGNLLRFSQTFFGVDIKLNRGSVFDSLLSNLDKGLLRGRERGGLIVKTHLLITAAAASLCECRSSCGPQDASIGL